MRCDEFAALVHDLAREGLMNESARTEAVSHAAICETCASSLDANRGLNEALAAAAAAETETAPESVRLGLIREFTIRQRSAPAPAVRSATLRRYIAAAAAAVLILAMALSLRVIIRRQPGPAARPGPAGEVPLEAATQPPAKPDVKVPQPGEEGKVSKRRSQTERHGRYMAANPAQSAGRSPDSDALTGFIPLTHLSSSTAMQSGQVIRVRLPLSAFLALGLPVSPEHADDLVNAELVVGDDGVQRAVRLVR